MSSEAELIPLISKGLYIIVSEVIGAECIVKQRRDLSDIDVLPNIFLCDVIMSGSKADGFEMATSDCDLMYVRNDIVVVSSDRPLPETILQQNCVLTYDTDCTSPGFAVIRCSDEAISLSIVADSLVRTSIGPCFSSGLFRELLLKNAPSAEIHGPCLSSTSPLSGDIDIAYCLKCPYWPKEASSLITRSSRTGWPSQDVLTDICNDGCLFVPISSKQLQCRDAFENEWRMSFSLAEKKLVYSMNYCQFLCYGLLKIILNEVLKKNENIKDLLCSYFMKTAIFWEISEDSTGWTIQNFLCKFWSTFCRLLNWVHVGCCPNFFNPENNMFAGKVDGHRQKLLIEVLRSFHNEGVLFLLKCPSLNEDLTKILQNPYIATFVSVEEEEDTSEWCVELLKKFISVSKLKSISNGLGTQQLFQRLSKISSMSYSSNSMIDDLKLGKLSLLQRIAEDIIEQITGFNYSFVNNKAARKYILIAMNILRRNYTTFCENDILIAKSFYKLGVFHSTINVLYKLKIRLQNSQFMYWWTINEADCRRLSRDDMSCEIFLNSHLVLEVLINERNRISELDLEILTAKMSFGGEVLQIAPTVFVNFLLLLSYHHLGDTVRRDDVLSDLRLLVWSDDGHHIHLYSRAISWEILGICQQLCGDHHGAYQSYTNALNYKYSNIRPATIIRIQRLGYE